ncbi:hypothetical protein BTO06_13450 [Tenacibaculum sp. SZ-18]|uniref:hypothetical protein n=1 Tax=Tenacibaculum sp. SZ-18 TaxID=754423 RepID=UPI000C2D4F65|nr:hypothetical protein [Tenacibaculum sp. SZ-18]AUC16100.1 hypothetical protein BTO06_13450 [Tenacibaculum sp. SZ-18]
MVKDSYIYILNNPSFIEKQDAGEIKAVIDKYPYFQSARALFLKALKEQESFKYNNELKLTAAYTTDRSILFNFITSELFKENEKSDAKKETKNEYSSVNELERAKSDLGIGEPIAFTKSETHSFNQWLQISSGTIKKIIPIEEKSLQDNIIDKFIANNPKISRINKNSLPSSKAIETVKEPLLMTETLAKIYLEQKKYDNAIKAYEILSLKYPEKSTFFADRIKKIRILQKS